MLVFALIYRKKLKIIVMNKTFTFYLLAGFIFFAACSGSKNSYKSDQKDLGTLIKRLTKRGSDDKVMEDIKDVYYPAVEKGEQRIANFRYDAAPQKWDKLIPEMEAMQRMYDVINTNAYAFRVVQPINYYKQIKEAKDSAAADYYEYASTEFEKDGRESSKLAYYAYNRAGFFVSNYKESKQKMKEAFERSIVIVLVNEIQYDGFGSNNWGWNLNNNQTRIVSDQIIRELGGRNSNSIPARFYSNWDLRRENIAPHLVVDLMWRNLQFDQPRDQIRNYNRSKQIEVGKDTANRPIYQTVTATVYVTQRQLNANADLNFILTDAARRQQIDWQTIPSSYNYNLEFAEYNGDRRALDNNDWDIINRSRNQPMPTQEDALNEMMQRIKNDVVNRIRSASNW